MGRLDTRRIAQYLLVLVIAVTINFLLPRFMPGNPLALIAGVDVGLLTPEQRAEIVTAAGLDQSLLQQYVQYWGNLLTGDLGFSYRSSRPIIEMITERLPWTLLLTLASLAISALVGVTTGAISAWRRGKASDLTSLTTMISLESMPPFWLGMLLISGFAVTLGILPSFGAETAASGLTGWDRALDIAQHAVLPVATLSIVSTPAVYLTMRYSMLETLGEDYIRTARAKGASEARLLFRHVARNALAPVLTVLAIRLGFAFGGTVVIETVFSYPGLGRLTFEAVGGRDYPVMQAAFLVFTIAMLLANLAADLIYPVLDPRTRASR
ncbi:ABC transporter permease [Euzebya tangerina]|uniref:ABC transporter permease n=1 Tax=Euzebya tangerina TaxID=591198 RepID=UPI000E31B8D1|nr:ABC transporter permease [Euzebya tangerina]